MCDSGFGLCGGAESQGLHQSKVVKQEKPVRNSQESHHGLIEQGKPMIGMADICPVDPEVCKLAGIRAPASLTGSP